MQKVTTYFFNNIEDLASFGYYLNNLQFEEKPNYSYLRKILQELLHNIPDNKEFDWVIKTV